MTRTLSHCYYRKLYILYYSVLMRASKISSLTHQGVHADAHGQLSAVGHPLHVSAYRLFYCFGCWQVIKQFIFIKKTTPPQKKTPNKNSRSILQLNCVQETVRYKYASQGLRNRLNFIHPSCTDVGVTCRSHAWCLSWCSRLATSKYSCSLHSDWCYKTPVSK